MMNRDECYRILEIPPDATQEEIRSAWRELNKVWHPDRFGDDDVMRRKAEEKLKRINQAYDILKRSTTRGFGSRRSTSREKERSGAETGPEWKVRDSQREISAKNFEQLARWVLGGKVVGSDEVLDPRQGSWLRVDDVPELARLIRIRGIQKWTRFALFAGILGFALLIRRPVGFTAVIGLAMMGFAVVMMWIYRRSIS